MLNVFMTYCANNGTSIYPIQVILTRHLDLAALKLTYWLQAAPGLCVRVQFGCAIRPG